MHGRLRLLGVGCVPSRHSVNDRRQGNQDVLLPVRGSRFAEYMMDELAGYSWRERFRMACASGADIQPTAP
eukprot:1845625-Alexandrium_andersonii.AAC.1